MSVATHKGVDNYTSKSQVAYEARVASHYETFAPQTPVSFQGKYNNQDSNCMQEGMAQTISIASFEMTVKRNEDLERENRILRAQLKLCEEKLAELGLKKVEQTTKTQSCVELKNKPMSFTMASRPTLEQVLETELRAQREELARIQAAKDEKLNLFERQLAGLRRKLGHVDMDCDEKGQEDRIGVGRDIMMFQASFRSESSSEFNSDLFTTDTCDLSLDVSDPIVEE